MKKILAILIAIFLFNMEVSAASLCSYKEQTEINQKAANVKVTYEVVTDIVHFEDMDTTMDVFDISIFNITEDLYVIVKNNINDEEKVFTYNDTVDGVAKFRWTYADSVTNFTIQVYTTNKTSCPDEKFKTFYLTTPRYNEYYDVEVCQELSDFYLCQKFVTFSEIDEEKFFTQLDNYRNEDPNDKDKDIQDKDEKITDKIFNFLDENKWFIIGGLVIIIGGTLIIYKVKTKKQRELGL